MPNATLRADARLPELLAERARAASDLRLAADIAGGILAAAATLVWRPAVWVLLLSAALCFVAYGAWGIADRAIANRAIAGREGGSMRALHVVRGAAAALGTLAAVSLGVAVAALVFGQWKS